MEGAANVVPLGESPGAIVQEVRRAAEAAILSPLSIATTLDRTEERIERGVPRVSTGFALLDAALGGGLVVPSLNVLGAAPKSGKSTFAQMVATHFAEHHGLAYQLDLENGPGRYLRQLLCRRAQVGPREVSAALAKAPGGVFRSRDDLERWRKAKAWVRGLGPSLFAEFTPPVDFVSRVTSMRTLAGDRPLLVVVDSLQKLPCNLEDRRAGIDAWVRLLERLRHELDVVFFVISEIKRSQRGTYEASESAFKESGGIEYAADLAMTMTRPRADEDEVPGSTLRIELAREADEDPRGEVASYRPQFPFYGFEEGPPLPSGGPKRRGPAADKGEAARAFLKASLEAGPKSVDQVLADGRAAGLSRSVLYRAKGEVGAVSATVNLRSAWRLP